MGIFDFLTGKKSSLVSQDELRRWVASYTSRKSKSDGVSALGAGDYAKAVKQFGEQISKNPDKQEGYLLRSIAHMFRGNTKQSIKDAEKAMEINRNSPEPFLVKGLAMLQSDRPGEAVKDFKKAVTLDLHGRGAVGKIAQQAMDKIEGGKM